MTVPGQRSPTYTRERLADIARRYYVDDRTKLDIARETGLSRFAVARMLDRARAVGIVTITIEGVGAVPQVPPPRATVAAEPVPTDDAASTRLAERLGLDEAVVVRATGTTDEVHRAVGTAAARWVRGCVQAGDVVACVPPGGSPLTAARAAAATFTPPAGVAVADLPSARGAPADDGVDDPAWDAITAVLVDPAVAVATAGLRRVPHVVVVDTGAAAAKALIEAALCGPATVLITDAEAATAILERASGAPP